MAWNNKETSSGSLNERGFQVQSGGRTISGVYWVPAGTNPNQLCLIGHLASGHKKAQYVGQIAQGLGEQGIASMAIDAPGHGDRAKTTHPIGGYSSDLGALGRHFDEGGGTEGMVADWKSSLDFVESEFGNRATGYWGLQLGTMIGLPLTALDPRISCAVFGLMGNMGPNADDLMKHARAINCPVRFLVQLGDQKVTRDLALELFDVLATDRKTLHANPGRHSAVPTFEIVSSVHYISRLILAN
jgi:hypothetical protein